MKTLAKHTIKNNERDSNIELLRIIATVFIVAHHFAIHGGFVFSNESISINRLWIQFIQIGGKIGVNIFVLISGYFLVTVKSVKTIKVVKLWMQIFFYSVAVFIVFVAIGIENFGAKEFIKSLAPLTFSQWWFASAYFMLYLLSPYINILLKSFDQRQYIGYLVLLAFCWCVIPTITGRTFESNSLLWFVFVYSFAGYLRLFKFETKLTGRMLITLSFLCIVVTFMSVVVFDVLGKKISFFAENATFFYSMQKLPILVIAILMFVGFLKLNIGYIKFINIVASASFGIYLLHDHDYVRNWLWNQAFKIASYEENNMLILYSLFVIAVVFICCTVVEILRIFLLEKHYLSAVNKFVGFIEKVKNYTMNKIIKQL